MNSKKWTVYTRRLILGLLLAFFTLLMLSITIEYFPVKKNVAFLGIKQWVFRKHDATTSSVWFIAFYIHVAVSSICLIAGFTQFFKSFLNNNIHKYFGKLYVFVVLFLAAPSGLIMSFFADGGFWSKLAFFLLSVLWFVATAMAYTTARKKLFDKHGAWMLISYALTLSALTLRAWKWGIVNIADIEIKPMTLYRIIAWLGWVPNLIVALIMIRFNVHKKMISV